MDAWILYLLKQPHENYNHLCLIHGETDSERLSYLPEVTQRTAIQSWVCLTSVTNCSPRYSARQMHPVGIIG